MKHKIAILFAVTLAACDSPHPAFNSVERQTINVQGSVFRVRIKDDIAEAIRTNFEYRPKKLATFAKAAEAIKIASGCKVVANTMRGDPALMRAKIFCTQQTPPE